MDWLKHCTNLTKESNLPCQSCSSMFFRVFRLRNDIIADVESGTKEATGGKSGTKPIVSSKFAETLASLPLTDQQIPSHSQSVFLFLRVVVRRWPECPSVRMTEAIKVIDNIEHKMLHKLLSFMKGSRLPEIHAFDWPWRLQNWQRYYGKPRRLTKYRKRMKG